MPRIYERNLSILFNWRINPVRDLTHNYPPRSRSSIAILGWIRGYHPTVLPSAHHYEAGNLNSLRQILPFDIVDWQGASPDNFPPSFATEALSLRPILPVRHVDRQGRNLAISLRDPARPSPSRVVRRPQRRPSVVPATEVIFLRAAKTPLQLVPRPSTIRP